MVVAYALAAQFHGNAGLADFFRFHGQNNHGSVSLFARANKLGDGFGAYQRGITRKHHQRTGAAFERTTSGKNRMGGTQLLFLNNRGYVGKERLYLFPAVAHHANNGIDARSMRGFDDPTNKGLTKNLVSHLWFR